MNEEKIIPYHNDCVSYTQYARDVERVITQMDESLYREKDPEVQIMDFLKMAVFFYDGDWAGILDADITMKLWSASWWYNRRTDGMTPNSFGDLEEGDYLNTWINSLRSGDKIVINDIEEWKEKSPVEYLFLKRNHVRSLLAIPFWKRPTGFLIVRNPKRYISNSGILRMIAFAAVTAVNEKRLMDSTKLSSTSEHIKSNRDIVINLFGSLKIITSKGVLTETHLNSPRISRFIVYLLLHRNRPVPAMQIHGDLWPDEEPEKAGRAIKNLTYRLQQVFGLISDFRLIESSITGYRINPKLNITTDFDLFEHYWNEAQITASPVDRGHLLKKAMDLYMLGPLEDYAGEHWFMPTVTYYSLRYMGVVNQLLSALDMAGDYVCILEYANTAIRCIPGCLDAHYWLIYAMNHIGMGEMANSQLKVARQVLTDEDYVELLDKLGITE